MATKNHTRLNAAFDIQSALAAHVRASARAHEWAAKSITLRQGGKRLEANAAERKAKHWLRKMVALEAQAAMGKPRGGRPLRA